MNKKALSIILILVAFVSIPLIAEDWVRFGKRTQALYANKSADYEDAILWGMVTAANYNADFYDFSAVIYSKAEFTKLPKDLFGDAWNALIKQNYGLVMIDVKGISDYEELSALRLDDGNFVVISVTAAKE